MCVVLHSCVSSTFTGGPIYSDYVPFCPEVECSTAVVFRFRLWGCKIFSNLFQSLHVMHFCILIAHEKDLAYTDIWTTVWRDKNFTKGTFFQWASRPRLFFWITVQQNIQSWIQKQFGFLECLHLKTFHIPFHVLLMGLKSHCFSRLKTRISS